VKTKRKLALISGAAVVAIAVVGIVYAAIPGQDGVIHGCYNKSNGALRVIDSTTGNCTSKENPITWNQVGPMGPVGPRGVVGPQGPPGPESHAASYRLNGIATADPACQSYYGNPITCLPEGAILRFLGTDTVQVEVSEGQRLTGVTSLRLYSIDISVEIGLCYGTSLSGPNLFSGWPEDLGNSFYSGDEGRHTFADTSGPLPAGTYWVGTCVHNFSYWFPEDSGSVDTWSAVTGWVMVH